jgi:hypothetical protein
MNGRMLTKVKSTMRLSDKELFFQVYEDYYGGKIHVIETPGGHVFEILLIFEGKECLFVPRVFTSLESIHQHGIFPFKVISFQRISQNSKVLEEDTQHDNLIFKCIREYLCVCSH